MNRNRFTLVRHLVVFVVAIFTLTSLTAGATLASSRREDAGAPSLERKGVTEVRPFFLTYAILVLVLIVALLGCTTVRVPTPCPSISAAAEAGSPNCGYREERRTIGVLEPFRLAGRDLGHMFVCLFTTKECSSGTYKYGEPIDVRVVK
jgi:hypothetical protein